MPDWKKQNLFVDAYLNLLPLRRSGRLLVKAIGRAGICMSRLHCMCACACVCVGGGDGGVGVGVGIFSHTNETSISTRIFSVVGREST